MSALAAQGVYYLDEVVVLQGHAARAPRHTRALAHEVAPLVPHPVAPLVLEAVVYVPLPALAQVIQGLPGVLRPGQKPWVHLVRARLAETRLEAVAVVLRAPEPRYGYKSLHSLDMCTGAKICSPCFCF